VKNFSVVQKVCCALASIALLTGVNSLLAQAQSTNDSKTGVQPSSLSTNQNKTNLLKAPGPIPIDRALLKEFFGKFQSIDKTNKLVHLQPFSLASDGKLRAHGTLALEITDQTKVFKGEKPVKLDELVPGADIRFGIEFRHGRRALSFVRMENVPEMKPRTEAAEEKK
jgi:hypothetical protein